MKTRMAFVAAMAGLATALSGCSTVGGGGRATAYGPATPSAIISALGGGLIGGTLGQGLSADAREAALQAEYRALEHTQAGKSVDWRGSGGEGAVTAGQPYRVGSQDCRQYTQTVNAGGQNRTARGTACRNPDGSWTLLT